METQAQTQTRMSIGKWSRYRRPASAVGGRVEPNIEADEGEREGNVMNSIADDVVVMML
jgi:hypothetical protein